jgi:methionyl-tRNA formyltransferase
MCDLFALAEGAAAGFSVHVMNEKIDDGPILQKVVVSPPGSKDYLGHLLRGSQLEGEVVGRLLQEVAKDFKLPRGQPNVPGPSGAIYRKFKPTRSLVLQLKTQGVRL